MFSIIVTILFVIKYLKFFVNIPDFALAFCIEFYILLVSWHLWWIPHSLFHI